jgi:hypothetical protein
MNAEIDAAVGILAMVAAVVGGGFAVYGLTRGVWWVFHRGDDR